MQTFAGSRIQETRDWALSLQAPGINKKVPKALGQTHFPINMDWALIEIGSNRIGCHELRQPVGIQVFQILTCF